jgi:uncharacterized RDD family membrane protein YckC
VCAPIRQRLRTVVENRDVNEPVFTLATWQRRVIAGLIDYGAPLLLINVFARAGGAVLAVAFLVSAAFTMWNLVQQGATGQTVGKRATGLLLVRETDAQPVGPMLSVSRWVTHVVDTLPFFAGYLSPLWDGRKQTFADKICRTVVIDTR